MPCFSLCLQRYDSPPASPAAQRSTHLTRLLLALCPTASPTATTSRNDAFRTRIRPSTRAYVRAIVQKSSSSAGLTVAVAASAASKSAAAPSSDHAAASNASLSAQSEVLLEGTARVRTGLTWFKTSKVQLLAAPALEDMPDAPAWSALVVDGVPLPYEEVGRVRMDEGALEFVVEHKPATMTAQDAPPRQHLRMQSRSEFNLWREALGPIIADPHSFAKTSAGSKPSAVHAAQKWLAHAEDGAAPCS